MTSVLRKFHEDGTLPPDFTWVWVFGSNTEGIHGGGAAFVAKLDFGYPMGKSMGRVDRAYAIPTKVALDGVVGDALPIEEVELGIRMFILHANQRPSDNFWVTAIGCGLAGFDHAQIAPMFKMAPSNCNFPEPWREFIG